MAKRGREAMAKRARERIRQEKQEAKEEKRLERAANEEEPLSAAEETALMEEFARLSRRYQDEEISESDYQEQRRRIFDQLGLDPDE